jgi:hypothetical protein
MDKPTLSSVLGQAGEQLTVSAQVYFDNQLAFINGYRPDGGKWVRFSYEQRIELPLPSLDRVFRRYGWALSQRPIKQAGLVMNYMLVRSVDSTGYSTTQISAQAIERRQTDDRLAELDAIADLVFA